MPSHSVRIEPESEQEFKIVRKVAFSQTDGSGVMYFANYMVIFGDTLADFFKEKGLTSTLNGGLFVSGSGKIYADTWWAFGEVNCRYYAPSKFEDILEISVMVGEISGKKTNFVFKCFNKTTQKLSAVGEMIAFCIDHKTGQSVEIPHEIKELLMC
jgi:acyl-CoA thioester hydrolase